MTLRDVEATQRLATAGIPETPKALKGQRDIVTKDKEQESRH